MALVLKIAIASAALAAAFVYGSEHGTIGTRPVPARMTVGAPSTAEPVASGGIKRSVRIIALSAREPV